MSSAGQLLVAGRIPSEQIASTMNITNSATVTTTETVILTVIAPLVAGRTYDIESDFGFVLSVANDIFDLFLKENGTSGTQLQRRRVEDETTVSFIGTRLKARFLALATANKTFVVTAVRSAGTGNFIMNGSSTSPAFLDVYYRSG